MQIKILTNICIAKRNNKSVFPAVNIASSAHLPAKKLLIHPSKPFDLSFKAYFDNIYNTLLQPLNELDKSLNTVTGILAYVSLANEINAKFDDTFKAAIEKVQQQYPGNVKEMKAYVALLKQQFHDRYLPGKKTGR